MPENSAESCHVALLRGINLAGHNRLAMKNLVRLCEGLGAREVRTWLQSGNVVYRAAPPLAEAMAGALTAALRTELGLEVPVITRAAAAFCAARDASPFIARGLAPSTVHVAFLDRVPDPDRVEALDPGRSPGDAFEVVGAEVHLHLPNGAARTKLNNVWMDRCLGVVSTVRNWNTVTALAEWLDSPGRR